MAEKPSAMIVDLTDYEAIKALTQKTTCGNFTISYNREDTHFVSIYHDQALELEKKNPKSGWKVHVSLDKANLARGWKIFAELAIAYNLMDFKVYRVPQNNAKEITIYCGCYQNPAGVIHLQSFLKALNERFIKEGIKFVDPEVLQDSLIVSDFINARNDYVSNFPRLGSIPEAPEGYVAGIHVLFLKEIHNHEHHKSYGMMTFDQIFLEVLKKYGENPTYRQIARLGRADAFKQEIKLLFDKMNIKTELDPQWYNIGGEKDFLRLLEMKHALKGEIKEDEQHTRVQEKSELLGFPSRKKEEEFLLNKKHQTEYKNGLKLRIQQLQKKVSQIEQYKNAAIKAQGKQKAKNPDELVQRLQNAQSGLDDTIQIMTIQVQEARAELAVREEELKEYKKLSSQDQAQFLMDKDPAFKAKATLYAEVRREVKEAIDQEPQLTGVTIDLQLLNSAIMYSLAKLEGASNKDAAKKLVNWTIGQDGVPKPKDKHCLLTMSMIHNMSYTAYLEVADQTIEKMKSDKEVKTDIPPPSPSQLRPGTP